MNNEELGRMKYFARSYQKIITAVLLLPHFFTRCSGPYKPTRIMLTRFFKTRLLSLVLLRLLKLDLANVPFHLGFSRFMPIQACNFEKKLAGYK